MATIKTPVTITIAIERPGLVDTGFGMVPGEVETEHELRAEVYHYGANQDPEIVWLDQAVLDDLELTAAELLGAEEKAYEAAYTAMYAAPDTREEGPPLPVFDADDGEFCGKVSA